MRAYFYNAPYTVREKRERAAAELAMKRQSFSHRLRRVCIAVTLISGACLYFLR